MCCMRPQWLRSMACLLRARAACYERLYPGAVPPDGTVTAKGFSDPNFQLIGQSDVILAYDIRYLASTGYLWVVYTITSPPQFPQPRPLLLSTRSRGCLQARGAQNAFALLLPGAGAGARARAALAGSAGTRTPAGTHRDNVICYMSYV